MHNTLYCLVETKTEGYEDYSYSEGDFYEDAFILANTDYVSDFQDPEEAISYEMDNLPPYVERTGEKTFRYDIEKLSEMFREKYQGFKAKAFKITADEFSRDSLELFQLKSSICDEFDSIVHCEDFGSMYIDDFHRHVISGDIGPEFVLAGVLDYHI